MTIIRSPEKITTGFLIADKRNTENKKLSWGARGLLVFLLGKPDNWSVVIEHLIDQTKESAKPTGRDGVYSLLNELIAAGYIVRSQSRIKGKMSSYDYIVYSSPQHNEPLMDSPLTDEPLAAKTTLISNDFKQETKSLKNDLLTSKEAAPAIEQNPLDNVETSIIEEQPQIIPTLINGFNELAESQGQSQTVKNPIVKEKVSQKRKRAGDGESQITNPRTGEVIYITEAFKNDLWAFISDNPDGYWRRILKTREAALIRAKTPNRNPQSLLGQYCDWKLNQSPDPTTIASTTQSRANFICDWL